MTCVIVEDEIPAQAILQNYINKIKPLECLAVFKAAIEARSFLLNNTVDLVFLDINLPDISGLDFIKSVPNSPYIIITTAYPDYAVASFELDTIVDYLVKPFAFHRFLKAVNKAKITLKNQHSKTQKKETLFLNVDKTLHKIELDHILFVESDRNYITLHTIETRFTFIDTLKQWNNKLDKPNFVQIHKSYIVNMDYIKKISGNTVFIANKQIRIGRTYKNKLLTLLNIV